MIEVNHQYDVARAREVFSLSLDRIMMGNYLPQLILEEIAKAIAQKYTQEYYQEIVGLLDQQAIANLVIASAGEKINETLNKKLPDKVLEIVRTQKEIYQKGIFGGLTRIA